ncbi:hypothetical protein L6164_013611 [Bauhinia variegata]|uniref:Uncharacterized protein n=1 Tax=Bauhinia variegata TaxID=167791 RepID=A0ACB9NGS0_BAUVA|nr:hypothetical protein L6164_013611 [Bauhinia variegata]
MGVFTFEEESHSTASPAKLYKALVTDSDTVIPKAVDPIQSVETVEGSGGVGTVKKFTFIEDGKTGHVLHKVEAIDEGNYAYNYSLVGGDPFPESVDKISFETKLAAGPNGGSIAKIIVKYHTKGDAKPSDEELAAGKAKGETLFKAVEAFVLANPNY